MTETTRQARDRIIAQLRERRVAMGLSLNEVARRINPSGGRADVCDWERGEGTPSLSNLVAWSRALGYSLDLSEVTDFPV